MKRYEGLFILNTAGKEEGIKELIDKISSELSAAGAKVETVQKMDKRQFSRVADKRVSSGFYVNFIFEIETSGMANLRSRFALNEDVFRVSFTEAGAQKDFSAAPAAA
ncbi:MAG TPA: 30S ribosomal protein S6 [Methylomirabilota bacterium]|nr:30S ribosomal protein S6 [Methylomirabilota bacterium]